jgi:hypothetical protein
VPDFFNSLLAVPRPHLDCIDSGRDRRKSNHLQIVTVLAVGFELTMRLTG